MSTWDRQNYYYSGQGVVLVGQRDANGKPLDLRAVGNCTALTIGVETTVVEHKEQQSGQRATDFRLTTDTKCTLSATFENFVRDILALALRGDYTDHAAGTVTGEAMPWYPAGVQPALKTKLSSVAVKRGLTALDVYVNDATAWDYKLNSETGSVYFNDGSVTAVSKITTGGTAPTVIAVGATTTVTVANTATAGQYAAFTGFAGADAALINGKAHKIVSATSSQVVIDLNTTGKTITLGTPLSCFSGQALTIDYTYDAQKQIDALTQGSQERFLRFEGLNTLDSNNPVVIEIFKFVVDPAAQTALISGEEAASFELSGNVLSDALQTSGSKFFRVRSLR